MSIDAASRFNKLGSCLLVGCIMTSLLISFATHSVNATDFSIPTAKLLDKLSGTQRHGAFFFSMIPITAFVASFMYGLLSKISPQKLPTPLQNISGILVFGLATLFMTWVCFFVPPSFHIGGGKFSTIYRLSAASPLALGLVFGLLMYSLATALALTIVSLRNLIFRA